MQIELQYTERKNLLQC